MPRGRVRVALCICNRRPAPNGPTLLRRHIRLPSLQIRSPWPVTHHSPFSTHRTHRQYAPRRSGLGFRIMRIELNRPVKEFPAAGNILGSEAVKQIHTAQEVIKRVKVPRFGFFCSPLPGFTQPTTVASRQRTNDCFGDFILYCEYIGDLAIETLGPQMQPRGTINKLCCNSYSVV